jgi:hypothetical protein
VQRAFIWIAKYLGILACPFLIVLGAYELASLMPGTIKTDHWRLFSSGVFILTIIPIALLLIRSRLPWLARIAASIPALALISLAALTIQLKSTCGDEQVYIGLNNENAAISCN